jgi:predicted RNA-binding protein with PIN domain
MIGRKVSMFGTDGVRACYFFPSIGNFRIKFSESWKPMDYDQLIIDGYNLMHQDEALNGRRDDLPIARQRLVRRIEQVASGMASKITVVFDGREHGRDIALDAPNLEVLFSPSNRTADGVIEQMVHDAKDSSRILVVTSDWIEQRLVSVFGASVISCREFLSRCETTPSIPRRADPPKGSTLGDFFPE